MKKLIAILLLSFTTQITLGQLSLCNGSKGSPIFKENFGSGTTFGPQLPSGITSYTYIAGAPSDGFYTLYYKTDLKSSWHNTVDHTPDTETDGFNGKNFILNAAAAAGEFYKRSVTGLCDNTDFEFSAWIINLYDTNSGSCSGTGKPIDVTFEIWNATETVMIKTGTTGSIAGTPNPIWTQYGLSFTTLPGQTDVVLKLKNNGAGGCGNDLALDDIAFSACNDLSKITSPGITGNSKTYCPNELPVTLPLNLIIANASNHVYQWQESTDNITWTDIIAETGLNYNATITATKYYRVKVAKNLSGLNNASCYTVSELFNVIVNPKPTAPTTPNPTVTICSAQPIPALTVNVSVGNSVNWYDALTGGNLIQSNSTSYTPTAAGIYYAEAFIPSNSCSNTTRTPVELIINNQNPPVTETVYFCENQISIDLDAVDLNGTYLWSTLSADTTQKITVTTAGVYSVIITNSLGCYYTKTITVEQISFPLISNIDTNNDTVTIETIVPGNYEYAIDGIYYQSSNTFYDVKGGLHVANVRGLNNCGKDERYFFLLVVPKFFTPNNDNYQDYFEIEGLSYYPKATIAIFDRYGKLLKYAGPDYKWDGTYLGNQLPSCDYWYKISLGNGTELKGHFTLKR